MEAWDGQNMDATVGHTNDWTPDPVATVVMEQVHHSKNQNSILFIFHNTYAISLLEGWRCDCHETLRWAYVRNGYLRALPLTTHQGFFSPETIQTPSFIEQASSLIGQIIGWIESEGSTPATNLI